MNIPSSEWSSGCESGWTLYLDQSSVSATQYQRGGGGVVDDEDYRGKGGKEDDNYKEEDLSMVSDASSGPPHFHEDDEDGDGHFCSASSAYSESSSKKSKRKMKMKKHGSKEQHSYLDDTASSPVLSLSKKNLTPSNHQGPMDHVLDFSQGFSATHYKVIIFLLFWVSPISSNLVVSSYNCSSIGELVSSCRGNLHSRSTSASSSPIFMENLLHKNQVVFKEESGNKIL
ncbi:hypothetical protein L1049_026911 [Liquidambar formosana]|uniref:Uncharacterized protein n=1 Tax=Liquidambar formosana TaxID=63359 RepID=A0AAP0R940_LIQFO